VVFELGAVVLALCHVLRPMMFSVDLSAFFATMVAAFVSWIEVKRHRELKTSYAIAASELGEIGALATSVCTERDLQSLVENGESAISREHTLWLARRDADIGR